MDKNSRKSLWGWVLAVIGCVVVTVIIGGSLSPSFSFKYGVGVVLAVILALAVGYYIYKSSKDK